jgi:hypothetical protein
MICLPDTQRRGGRGGQGLGREDSFFMSLIWATSSWKSHHDQHVLGALRHSHAVIIRAATRAADWTCDGTVNAANWVLE